MKRANTEAEKAKAETERAKQEIERSNSMGMLRMEESHPPPNGRFYQIGLFSKSTDRTFNPLCRQACRLERQSDVQSVSILERIKPYSLKA